MSFIPEDFSWRSVLLAASAIFVKSSMTSFSALKVRVEVFFEMMSSGELKSVFIDTDLVCSFSSSGIILASSSF